MRERERESVERPADAGGHLTSHGDAGRLQSTTSPLSSLPHGPHPWTPLWRGGFAPSGDVRGRSVAGTAPSRWCTARSPTRCAPVSAAGALGLSCQPPSRPLLSRPATDAVGSGCSPPDGGAEQKAALPHSVGWSGGNSNARARFRNAEFSGSLAEKGTPHQRSNPIATQESRDPAPARVSVRRSRHVYRRMRCENDVQSRTLRLYRGG